jgi:hypothetical protein
MNFNVDSPEEIGSMGYVVINARVMKAHLKSYRQYLTTEHESNITDSNIANIISL